jgi:pimeloyl-ACP methyl ester carboxylesterase
MKWNDQGATRQTSLWRRRAWMSLFACFCLTAVVFAQPAATDTKPDDKKPKGPPDPEDITVNSKDNVVVHCTYWEPEEPAKETIPIILLHGWEGNRQEFDLLGKFLQAQGHAVISVDLRGHGDSTILRRPGAPEDIEIQREKLTKPALEAMVYDVQAAKDFLFDKHVEGLLNLNQLCVVGADMGAIVALNFAAYDWTRPRYPAKIFKNGQDVQGLVLLSPPQTGIKGLTAKNALLNPQVAGQVSTLIVVGGDSRTPAADARKLHGMLANKHVKVPEGAPAAVKADKTDLFIQSLGTELQGTKLLVRGLNVDKMIAQFIKLRLVDKAADFPWAEREKPR